MRSPSSSLASRFGKKLSRGAKAPDSLQAIQNNENIIFSEFALLPPAVCYTESIVSWKRGRRQAAFVFSGCLPDTPVPLHDFSRDDLLSCQLPNTPVSGLDFRRTALLHPKLAALAAEEIPRVHATPSGVL